MVDKVDAGLVARLRLESAGAAPMADVKPAMVTRALRIYLWAFVGALGFAAMLLLQPVFWGKTATRPAPTLAQKPSAEVPLPERSSLRSTPEAAAGIDAPAASVSSPPAPVAEISFGPVAGAHAAVLPPASVATPAASAVPAASAGPPGNVEPSLPADVAALAAPLPPGQVSPVAQPAPVITPMPASARPAAAAANKPRPAAGYPARSRLSAFPPRQAARIGTAAPLARGAAGLGCPAGSDPRWSEPDASGAPTLICNPYYSRTTISVF